MFCVKPKIIANKKISGCYLKLTLLAPGIAGSALPGQFIMARVNNGYEPLLRRPFSIHRVIGENIEILYEVVGKGTEILSQKKPGEYLDIIGPLGNGFNLTPNTYNLIPFLIAGGMGVAPLTFLAEKLRKSEIRNPKSEIVVLLGAKTKNQLSCEKEFKNLGYNVKIATDDGSRGFKGKVTDLLKSILLTTHNSQLTTIYACGPKLMLKEIARISTKYKIPAQVSLEEYMACGIGACLGCAVKTKSGYQRVCKEGPVFDTRKLY